MDSGLAESGSAAPGGDLRLHLGCGPHIVSGWQNLDKSPSVLLAAWPRVRSALRTIGLLTAVQRAGFPRGIIYADASKHIPYADESVSYIYTSHMLEHLSDWQARNLVSECARVLVPGGVVRIATPDLATLVDSYHRRDFSHRKTQELPGRAFMSELGTFVEREGTAGQRLLWRVFSAAPHQWLYDAESLAALLEENGLAHAVERSFREGRVPELEILETRPRSLFMEASKP